MYDIGTLCCSVRLPQYREGVSGVLCAHVCLSARLFPCAWRTLLKAGTVEQVYESCGVRFRAGCNCLCPLCRGDPCDRPWGKRTDKYLLLLIDTGVCCLSCYD